MSAKVEQYVYVVLGVEGEWERPLLSISDNLRVTEMYDMNDGRQMPYSVFLLLPFGAGSRGVRMYVTVLVTT